MRAPLTRSLLAHNNRFRCSPLSAAINTRKRRAMRDARDLRMRRACTIGKTRQEDIAFAPQKCNLQRNHHYRDASAVYNRKYYNRPANAERVANKGDYASKFLRTACKLNRYTVIGIANSTLSEIILLADPVFTWGLTNGTRSRSWIKHAGSERAIFFPNYIFLLRALLLRVNTPS